LRILYTVYMRVDYKFYLTTKYLYDLNLLYIMCTNMKNLNWYTAVFYLTILYKDKE